MHRLRGAVKMPLRAQRDAQYYFSATSVLLQYYFSATPVLLQYYFSATSVLLQYYEERKRWSGIVER